MMSNFYQKLIQSTLIAGGIFATTPPAWATSFTINSGETITASQDLDVDGDTGLIVSGGFLNVTGIPITVSNNADNVVITNTIIMPINDNNSWFQIQEDTMSVSPYEHLNIILQANNAEIYRNNETELQFLIEPVYHSYAQKNYTHTRSFRTSPKN